MTRTPTARRRPSIAQPAHADAAPEPVPTGLVWVSDAEPGLRRVRRGDRVHYLDAAGKRVRD